MNSFVDPQKRVSLTHSLTHSSSSSPHALFIWCLLSCTTLHVFLLYLPVLGSPSLCCLLAHAHSHAHANHIIPVIPYIGNQKNNFKHFLYRSLPSHLSVPGLDILDQHPAPHKK
mmetsp:Transcript_4993/g.14477  ORF Transcript_4993/g.14477 Transcript_4993/m.14477 type:complete len:114 (+) Transcript_4993:339-680(+)